MTEEKVAPRADPPTTLNVFFLDDEARARWPDLAMALDDANNQLARVRADFAHVRCLWGYIVALKRHGRGGWG